MATTFSHGSSWFSYIRKFLSFIRTRGAIKHKCVYIHIYISSICKLIKLHSWFTNQEEWHLLQQKVKSIYSSILLRDFRIRKLVVCKIRGFWVDFLCDWFIVFFIFFFFHWFVGWLTYLQARLVAASLYNGGIGGEEGKLGCHGQQQKSLCESFVLCF